MERFPIIVTLGAVLIGWVGGETLASDVALKDLLAGNPWLHDATATAGAGIVLGGGQVLRWRAARQAQEGTR